MQGNTRFEKTNPVNKISTFTNDGDGRFATLACALQRGANRLGRGNIHISKDIRRPGSLARPPPKTLSQFAVLLSNRTTHTAEGKCSRNGGILRRSVFYHRDRRNSTHETPCSFGRVTPTDRRVFQLKLRSQHSPVVPPVASAALH